MYCRFSHYCTIKIRTNHSTLNICDFNLNFLDTVNKEPINLKNTGKYIMAQMQILVMMFN